MSGPFILDPHFLSVVKFNVFISGLKTQTICHVYGGCGCGGCDLRSLRKKKGLAEMFSHSCSACQIPQIYSHLSQHSSGCEMTEVKRGTTERMRQPTGEYMVEIFDFLYLLSRESGVQCLPAEGCFFVSVSQTDFLHMLTNNI